MTFTGPRFVVAQQSESWGQRTWYNVVDQIDPKNHLIIARCTDISKAALIAAALNHYQHAVEGALAAIKEFHNG